MESRTSQRRRSAAGLRARKEPQREAFRFGPYRLFPTCRELILGDTRIELGDRAFDALVLLVQRRGEVVTHQEMRDHVWPGINIDDTSIRTQIAQLRRVLSDAADPTDYISNIRGRGYRFSASVEPIPDTRSPSPLTANAQNRPKLPGRIGRLLGRHRCLDLLRNQLKASRFLTIVGSGGLGKTTLAVEMAHGLAREFDNEVFFVELGPLKSADLVLPTIAFAFGYKVQSPELLAGLAAFIGEHPALLVLDCCEHVIETAAEIASTLFRLCPRLSVLATSREPLRANGELVHLLSSLELPVDKHDISAAEALSAPSVQLFMQRAAASGYLGELGEADANAVAEVCRQLDGNPLAIELTGSRLVTYGFAGLATALGGRSILNWPGQRHEPRHRTLEATLDWSYQLLSELERRVLARLSVFVGAFTMNAAQEVASDESDDRWAVARAVENLADKSLLAIRVSGGTHYYRILDVTRFYAEAKLAESGEHPRVASRHAAFCVIYLEKRAETEREGRTPDLQTSAMEIGNVSLALGWCFGPSAHYALGVELAALACRMLIERSMLAECRKWADRALAVMHESLRGSLVELRLQEALALSAMYTAGNSEMVRTAIDRGIELAKQLEEREHELHLLAGLNLFFTRREELLGALACAERFMAVAAETQNPAAIVAGDWMLGAAQHLIGHERTGQEILERGFTRHEAFGSRNAYYFGYDHWIRAAIGRAQIAWVCGEPEEAVKHAKIVLEASLATNHPVSICIAHQYVLPVIGWLQDWTWLEDVSDVLIDVATKHSLRPYYNGGLAARGELLLARGDVEATLALLQKVIEALNAGQQTMVLTMTRRAYAEALARAGFHDEAKRTISELVRRTRSGFPNTMEPELIRTQADVMSMAGREPPERVEACYREAIACAQSHGAVGWELRATLSLARFWIGQDRPAEAGEILRPMGLKFAEGRNFGDVYEAHELLRRTA